MSTTTLRFSLNINGVLTDATSVVLRDAANAFGVRRTDTLATVVAAGTAMTRTSAGQYEYSFTDPAAGLTYNYWVEWAYDGSTYRVEQNISAQAFVSGITLDTMVSDLAADVPATNSVPSDAKYARIVKEAVDDFNRRAPMRKRGTIAVVSGTAEYALPNDFVKMLALANLANANNLVVTDVLTPLAARSRSLERWFVQSRTLTFSPTPTYTFDREYWYAAGHVLDNTNAYPNMTDADARLILMLARALALKTQADAIVTSGSGQITSYKIGDESITRTDRKQELLDEADKWRAEYLNAITAQAGTAIGMRSAYDDYGQPIL